jgi:hypothetical protein
LANCVRWRNRRIGRDWFLNRCDLWHRMACAELADSVRPTACALSCAPCLVGRALPATPGGVCGDGGRPKLPRRRASPTQRRRTVTLRPTTQPPAAHRPDHAVHRRALGSRRGKRDDPFRIVGFDRGKPWCRGNTRT